MTCNPYNIKVTEGNSFAVILTLKTRTYSADTPIDQDIDPTALVDVHVKVNGAEWSAFTVGVEGVSVQFPATQPKGTYNVELTANYNGIIIRAAYFECVTIVAWSYQSDAQNYIPDSPLSAKAAYIIAGNYTDAELEALKQQYRDAIEAAEQAERDAEQAKEDYIEKADNLDNLDNVAQQGSNPNATNTAILEGINNITIDTSTLAQRTDVKDGNDTAISAIKEVLSEVGTSSDTASESGTTLFAVLKWVKDKVKSIFNLIGSPASGQPSTLFAAIAAGGGGGGDAQESTSQEILAKVQSIIDSHIINNTSLDGYVFIEGFVPYGAGSLCTQTQNLLYVYDDKLIFLNRPHLFNGSINIQEVHFPNLNQIGATNAGYFRSASLRVLDIPYAPASAAGFYNMHDAIRLIDLTIGISFTSNSVISGWDPTNALLTNSTDLLTAEDIAAGFTSNREKLLYNIREHIAANLPDRTGLSALTITFSAAVKAAINGDTATAQAFSNKNWTIA